jgi:hypothetical protein
MVVVLRQERKSRLAAMIDQPGGCSVGVALAQAKANLEALQSKSLRIVAERIAELARLKAPEAADPDGPRALTHAYNLSSAIIDAAGPFELYDLCKIATGLCDLIDAAPKGRPFDWRVITVHAQSMQLIMSLPPEALETRVQVLDSLKKVLEKKIPVALRSDEAV